MTAESAARELSTNRDLASYTVNPADRGRNRLWLVGWLSVQSAMHSGCLPRRAFPPLLRLFGAKIGGDVHLSRSVRVHFPWKLEIGRGSVIGHGVWFINPEPIHVGRDAMVAPGATLCSGGHDPYSASFTRTSERVQVGDRVSIGLRAVILKGVSVQDDCRIAAGQTVSKRSGLGSSDSEPDGV